MAEALTYEEYERLIEAMKAWENSDAAGEMLADLVVGVWGKDDEKIKQDRANQKADAERRKKIKAEQSTILQAKLIRLRDEQFAETALKAAR